MASFPVAILFPAWSFRSTLENFGITPSLKFNRTSVGALATTPSAGGVADFSVGWALAEVAISPAASRASTLTLVLFNMLSFLLCKVAVHVALPAIREWVGSGSGVPLSPTRRACMTTTLARNVRIWSYHQRR